MRAIMDHAAALAALTTLALAAGAAVQARS
jgi:hypothetical protein